MKSREQIARDSELARHRAHAAKHRGRLPERSPFAAFTVDVRGSLALTWHETLDDAMTSLRWDLGSQLATRTAADGRVLVWRHAGLLDDDPEHREFIASIDPVQAAGEGC